MTAKLPAELLTRAPPINYSDELAGRVIDRLAAGEMLVDICKDEGMPSARTVHRWVLAKPEFKTKYDEARVLMAWNMFEETIHISDDGSRDLHIDDKGKVQTNNAAVGRDRLKVDTRKWYLAKFLPRIFGEHSSVEIDARIETIDLTDFEIARRLSFLQDKLIRAKTIDQEPKTMNETGTGI